MQDHAAEGIGAADPRTWIPALLAHAGPAGGAVAVDNALGTAVGRGAHVTRLTGADTRPAAHPLLAIGPARVLAAGVRVF